MKKNYTKETVEISKMLTMSTDISHGYLIFDNKKIKISIPYYFDSLNRILNDVDIDKHEDDFMELTSLIEHVILNFASEILDIPYDDLYVEDYEFDIDKNETKILHFYIEQFD